MSPVQLQMVSCQTQGPQFYLDQNANLDYESEMDEHRYRYNFLAHSTLMGSHIGKAYIVQKVFIMNKPRNDELKQ